MCCTACLTLCVCGVWGVVVVFRCKGDASLTFEDPNAAASAPAFFNDTELAGYPGKKIGVQLADTKVRRARTRKARREGRRRERLLLCLTSCQEPSRRVDPWLRLCLPVVVFLFAFTGR